MVSKNGKPAIGWWTDAAATLPPIATLGEVGELLRITPRHVRRLVATGQLGSIRGVESGSSRLRIPRAAVADYLRDLDSRRVTRW